MKNLMKTEYNQKIIGILQKHLRYAVPNHGQISRHFAEQAFYEYCLITEDFTESGMRVTLDIEQAVRFTGNNNIRILKECDMLK